MLFFIGLTQFRLRHFDVAEVALRRAIEIRPYGVGYHLALGMLLEADDGRLARESSARYQAPDWAGCLPPVLPAAGRLAPVRRTASIT